MTSIIFIFETSPNTKPKEKKWGDMAYYIPRVPQIGPMLPNMILCRMLKRKESALKQQAYSVVGESG